ncbi:hypothetical protein [uncultured Oscillibacter sp.]|jgi:hypothetical protein|uniref:hypothetical protein n=1 Tax=uncultured Oscillibacter sp. TaxID=876091 RepID=UPI002610ADE7|nr:hypothetical protein [uncultured Oscillibacter sp.]
MACKTSCKLCDRLVISQAVTFAGGNVVVNLPAGSYRNGCKYCIVIAQAIPAAATINAPVVVTIGTGTEQYPLTNRCCAQVTACGIRTQTRYSAVVSTNPTGGTFRLLGKTCPCPDNSLASIDGTPPAAPPAPTT